MFSIQRQPIAGSLYVLSSLLTVMSISGFVANAAAATATASIYVTILPEKALDNKTVHITPEKLNLTKGKNGKIAIYNYSGQRRSVHVDVTPDAIDGCRLSFTPKDVVLKDGQTQVFRLFYVTNNNSDCHAVFKLHIQYGDKGNKTVEVNCN